MKIISSRILAPNGRVEGSISIQDGRIETVDTERVKITNGTFGVSAGQVLPGFIDLHIHGAIGHDVNAATAEELLEVAAFLARNGVTAWVPTLVPDSDENYERIIGEIDRLTELQEGKPVAQALGVHYEGVFANEAMCGALRPEYFKSGRQLAGGGWRLPRLKKGIHMTTLAPEVDGGVDLIKRLIDDGWIVSIGHTKSDPATLDVAFNSGARHMTHFFNAMTGVHHRDIGVAGWGLAKRDVTFDIIADGIHVCQQMLKLACEAKGVEKVSLISDSVAPTGLGDGEFDLWGEKISVTNGRTRNERGSIAGSVITMHDAARRMIELGFSESDVARMASTNPATLLGLESRIGAIEVGKRADLVALDKDGSIKFTMIGGRVVEK